MRKPLGWRRRPRNVKKATITNGLPVNPRVIPEPATVYADQERSNEPMRVYCPYTANDARGWRTCASHGMC